MCAHRRAVQFFRVSEDSFLVLELGVFAGDEMRVRNLFRLELPKIEQAETIAFVALQVFELLTNGLPFLVRFDDGLIRERRVLGEYLEPAETPVAPLARRVALPASART